MQITSTAFANNGSIPAKHTCEGPDRLAGARLVGRAGRDEEVRADRRRPRRSRPGRAEDDVGSLGALRPAGVGDGGFPRRSRRRTCRRERSEGTNDWKRTGWGGPCPPIGRHRYFFKLYALDAVLPDLGKPTKAKLEAAMKGHVLAEAQLMGTYQKAR